MPKDANREKQDIGSKDISVSLDSGRWTKLKVETFHRGYSTPGRMIKDWVDAGMPLTAVAPEGQPAADSMGLRLATVTEERDSLKKQLGEVRKQLSAVEKKVAAGGSGVDAPGDPRLVEERDQLVKDVERLEKELKLSASERTRLELELKRSTAEVAQLKASGGKGEPESMVVARQGAKIEQLIRERDAARDERDKLQKRVDELACDLKEANSK